MVVTFNGQWQRGGATIKLNKREDQVVPAVYGSMVGADNGVPAF